VKVLVTGVAGFIGMHCAERLLARGGGLVEAAMEATRSKEPIA